MLLLVLVLVEPLLLDTLPLVKHATVTVLLHSRRRERVVGRLGAPSTRDARRPRLLAAVPRRPDRSRVRSSRVERQTTGVLVRRGGGVAVLCAKEVGEGGHRVAEEGAGSRGLVEERAEGVLELGLGLRSTGSRVVVRIVVDKVVALSVSLCSSVVSFFGGAVGGLLRGNALGGKGLLGDGS